MFKYFDLSKSIISTAALDAIAPPSQLRAHLSEYFTTMRLILDQLKSADFPKEMDRLVQSMEDAFNKVVITRHNEKDIYPHRSKVSFKFYPQDSEDKLDVFLNTKLTPYKDCKKKHPDLDRLLELDIQFFEARKLAAKTVDSSAKLLDTFLLFPIHELKRLTQGYCCRAEASKVKKVVERKHSPVLRAQTDEDADAMMRELLGGQKNGKNSKKSNRRRKARKKGKAKPVNNAKPKQGSKKTAAKVIKTFALTTHAPISQKKPKAPTCVELISLGTNQDPKNILHRNLWHQFARTLPSIIKQFSQQGCAQSLLRLSVTVLHGWMEKTLETLSEKAGGDEIKSHNLWTYRAILPEDAMEPVISDLHKAIHWTRFGQEWSEEWDRWSTLPYRPEVLRWFEQRQVSMISPEQSQQLELWYNQGEKISTAANVVLNTRQVPRKRHNSLNNVITPNLNSLLEKVSRIPNKTTWIKQWENDVTDLKGALKLLSGSITAQQLPLLVSHIMMLTTGLIQSPLYRLQKEDHGVHSIHHDLAALWKEAGLSLPEAEELWLQEQLNGIGSIHRYPFCGRVRSVAHRFYLNAIAIGLDPQLGEGFTPVEGGILEGELDSHGIPHLNEYVSADELRVRLIHWIEEISDRLGKPLLNAV